ncbi:MAG: alcohol dehydrogenase catalytic domain-containing protein [Candidatus Bathyarchaeia archaeon]
MRGVVFLGNRRVAVRDFPDPVPQPNEVVVRIKAASICGSDMSRFRGNASSEMVQGHEGSGIVEQVGDSVVNVKRGDRVSIYHHIGIDGCEMCRRGDWFYCKNRWTWGLGVRNGSFCNMLLTHANGCFKMPPELSYIDGSIISCRGGTAYQGLVKIGVGVDDFLVVFGLGPLGLSVVMFAKALGARVIGVEPIRIRRELGLKLGVEEVFDPFSEDIVEKVRNLTNGRLATAVAECSGNLEARNLALRCVGSFGRVVLLGMGPGKLSLDPNLFTGYDITLTGVHVWNVRLYDQIIRLMRNKSLHFEEMTTHRFTVEQAQEALETFDSGNSGNVVFCF